MHTDKAYKILAKAHGISHKKAKALIDDSRVCVNGRKITLARAEIPYNATFEILDIKSPQILFRDENILAIDKPAFIESYDLLTEFQQWRLLNRLDKETSGVILLTKEDSDFTLKAKEAFKTNQVYKEYIAIAHGRVVDNVVIEKPLITIKKGFAKSYVNKNGSHAHTQLIPLGIVGKKTLLKVLISTGRTHQIRVHCQSIGHPLCGDRIYGIKDNAKRLMLHSHKISILGYEFNAPIPKELQLESL